MENISGEERGGGMVKKVVIIGSGIGGLTAGNLLAQKGHKVTIFEAHSRPGGYTAGFFRKGCYFESGTISFESLDTVVRAMRGIGVLEQIEFEKLGLRVVSAHFDAVPENYEEFKKTVYAAFPREKNQLDKAFSDLDRILSALSGGSNMVMPSVMSRTELLKFVLPMILRLPNMIKVTNKFGDMTSSDFASQYFAKDSMLFNLFSKFSYPDASTIIMAVAMDGVFKDTWTVKGGMQSWADLLAENFRKLGGDLKCNAYVNRIITKDRIAVGVSCGDVIYEADYVIAAGDYKKTFLKLLDDKSLIPGRLLERIENAAVSEGFFTVYLVLDLPGDEFGGHMRCPHVFNIDYKGGCDIFDDEDEDYFS